MKLHSLLLPSAALGCALLLVWPAETEAFTVLGGMLNQGQRDVRVFDNFTAPTANNNTVPHPNFPGYVGAELAIWKAVVEWGSLPHGDGSGDPIEGTLGSGGANFDASWQGNALAVGGTDDNICSQVGGGGNGVYAFVETPIGDGWRMRFLRDRNASGGAWDWQDGPGDEDGGNSRPDLQGIATHEYGHALGLGHSTVSGSTMFGGVTVEGTSTARSIAADDINGVRFLYGLAVPTKPVITGVTVLGQQAEITGQNFVASNDVWFTQLVAGGDGTPVKVTNVPSTGNGTRILVDIPLTAGPGDVLVRTAGGGPGLSNAFPIDPQVSGFGSFCTLADNATLLCPCGSGSGTGGCENAEGTGGAKSEILAYVPTGPSAAIRVTGLPAGAPVVVLLRSATKLGAPVPFGDGLRCIGLPVTRLSTRMAANGESAHSFGHGKGPGTFHYQPWYRSTPQSFCDQAAAYNAGSGVSIAWP